MNGKLREFLVDGLLLAVPDDWAASGDVRNPIYGGESGRLDVRRVPGDLLDGARLASLKATMRREQELALLRIQGRTCLRSRMTRAGAYVCTYIFACRPEMCLTGAGIEEWRAVFAFGLEFEASMLGVLERIEGSDAQEVGLDTLRTNDDGHLAFGPFPVPAGWSLVGDDGVIVSIPSGGHSFVDVDFGGGYATVVGPSRSDGFFGRVEFRPVQLPSSDPRTHRTELLRLTGQDMEVDGPSSLTVVANDISLPGISDCAFEYSIVSTKDIARWGVFWTDVLGYSWEVAYSADVASLPALVGEARMRLLGKQT